MNLPNILTCSRIILTIIFLDLIYRWNNIPLASIIFILGSITDFLDGYLARRLNLITTFGKIMDPIADKFLILAAFYVLIPFLSVPFWLFFIIAFREILVTTIRLIVMKEGKVLAAEGAGKLKTVIQIVTIIFALLVMNMNLFMDASIISAALMSLTQVLFYITVAITVYSGILFFSKNWNILKS